MEIKLPPGVTPAPAWTEEIATAYRRALRRPPRTSRRTSGCSCAPASRDIQADQGLAGLVAASPVRVLGREARSTALQVVATSPGLPGLRRPGKTVCYAESIADASGKHGDKDPRWCGPEQYNYWRLLSDLNLGFSMIGVYGADLEQANHPEFRAAFDFAARYAGYHASPSVSPGAWVALREGVCCSRATIRS